MNTRQTGSGSFLLLFLIACYLGADTVAQSGHIKLQVGTRLDDQVTPCNEYTYYSVEFTEACQDLRVQLDVVEGEPNLYIAKSPNKYPTYSSLVWSSYNWGGEDLIISSWDPEFTFGTYYIGVHAYCGTDVPTGNTDSRYSLLVLSEQTTHPHTEIALGGSRSSTISANGYEYYRFCIPKSCANVEVRLGNCIDPTACPTSYAWPELLVSRTIVEPRTTDHTWKLAAIDQRSVILNHDDPDFYPGHYFVGVFGWCTPAEFCPDPATCGPCSYAENHDYNVSVLVEEVTSGCVPKQPLELCSLGWKNIGSPFLLLMGLLVGFILFFED